MRPIERGQIPKESSGINKSFTTYKKARADLILRLGDYCSYCEMQLDSSLAVEHVQPKKPPGAANVIVARELDWDNFLLACTNCNSNKGNTDVILNDYLWPDKNNTFKAIKYNVGGLVSATDEFGDDIKDKADALIKLTGLDKTPANDSEVKDRRWSKRRTVWGRAQRALDRLKLHDTFEMREQIIETAEEAGFWSVWMTVFKDDLDMKKRLINSAKYKGTVKMCFDVNCQPLDRILGAI
ncbi:HNH endonuclease [Pseudoalteromonas gelatinilytica]